MYQFNKLLCFFSAKFNVSRSSTTSMAPTLESTSFKLITLYRVHRANTRHDNYLRIWTFPNKYQNKLLHSIIMFQFERYHWASAGIVGKVILIISYGPYDMVHIKYISRYDILSWKCSVMYFCSEKVLKFFKIILFQKMSPLSNFLKIMNYLAEFSTKLSVWTWNFKMFTRLQTPK